METQRAMNYIKESFDISLGYDKNNYFISVFIKDPLLEFEGEKIIKEKDQTLFKQKVMTFLNYYLDKKIYQLIP